MGSVGLYHVIVSMNQNVLVFDRREGKKIKELDIRKKEMSTSLVLKDKLLIGTYVDTIFLFDIADDYKELHMLAVQDSVLSMCEFQEDLICCGQASGSINFVELYGPNKNKMRTIEEPSFMNTGYINHVYKTYEANEVALCCEKGL